MDAEVGRVLKESENVNTVLDLLANQPDEVLRSLDTAGGTLAFIAVQRALDEEALRVLKYLVEDRAVCQTEAKDSNQQTALYFAARDGNLQCVKYLVASGCNPNGLDSAGQTALFYACRDGRLEVVKSFIGEFGVDANVADHIGQTALFYAAREGHREIVEYMVETGGADARIRDWKKKCAHSYAQRRGYLGLAAYLKSVSMENIQEEKLLQTAQKGKKVLRNRCLLQNWVTLPSGGVWLFAGLPEAKDFERKFPQLAAWSHMQQTMVEPTDAFRMEWAHAGLQVVQIVSNFQDGWLFTKPVDTRAWNCPDYYEVVKNPRDLTMIRRNLRSLHYLSVASFLDDLDLMFANCFLYNSKATYVHEAGERVQAFCNTVLEERHFSKWLATEEELVAHLNANSPELAPIGREAAARRAENWGSSDVPKIAQDELVS